MKRLKIITHNSLNLVSAYSGHEIHEPVADVGGGGCSFNTGPKTLLKKMILLFTPTQWSRVVCRVQYETCHAEHLVAFSCKRRGFCPSCGARRMAESTALLVDEVLPQEPMRQWVLSVPFPLRFLFASQPKVMGKALGIVYRTIATHLTRKAGFTKTTAHTGAVTLIQRFGGALNLNIHFHMLFLDGVYVDGANGSTRFRCVKAPTGAELTQLALGSHTAWVVSSNGKDSWSGMRKMAIWPRMR